MLGCWGARRLAVAARGCGGAVAAGQPSRGCEARWLSAKAQRDSSASEGAQPSMKGRKRFYKETSVAEGAGGFQIHLDGRAVRTPYRHVLEVPSKALAEGVAHEWGRQGEEIEPSAMPLMVLACSALDQTEDRREVIVEELMRYLHTDTVLFPGDPEEVDGKLLQLQRTRWQPLIRWMGSTFGEVHERRALGVQPHPEETRANVVRFLTHDVDKWHLTALESLAAGCKSVIIPLALQAQQISAVEAVQASRVEEEHQITLWGLVEGNHDVDRVHSTAQIVAASVLMRLLQNPDTPQK